MKSKASVVVPVFNGYRWRETIRESLLCNSDRIGEVLIINDGDREDFDRLMHYISAAVSLPIRCFQTLGSTGAAAARNLGLDNAREPYLAFLDCDDLWCADSLAARLDLLEQSPSAFFAFGSVRLVTEKGRPISSYYVPSRGIRSTLLVTNYIFMSTVVLRVDQLGSRRFSNVGHEDYDLWLTLLSDLETDAVGCQSIMADVRLVAGSLSHNKGKAAGWHYQILKSNGIPLPVRALLFAGYACNGLLKKKLGYSRPLFFGLHHLARYY